MPPSLPPPAPHVPLGGVVEELGESKEDGSLNIWQLLLIVVLLLLALAGAVYCYCRKRRPAAVPSPRRKTQIRMTQIMANAAGVKPPLPPEERMSLAKNDAGERDAEQGGAELT